MKPVPSQLLARPFSRAEALDAGLTSRMLEGNRFVRVLPGVWLVRGHEMTWHDWVIAAGLSLPERCRVTGLTRLQLLGLDHGPRFPLRFVVEGDYHLEADRLFLHRTRKLAPVDEVGVRPAGAFMSYCSLARTIDAIKVGDWLLHHDLLQPDDVRELAGGAPWRDGAREAVWVLDHLDRRSRSLKESETRSVLRFAGLPDPEVNHPMSIEGSTVIGDLVFLRWRTVVEYEGLHHQQDRWQYASDIDRYAVLRSVDLSYVQVTHEMLTRPRRLVLQVHATLARNGYDGPPPQFGDRWAQLFMPLGRVLTSRDSFLRELARAG